MGSHLYLSELQIARWAFAVFSPGFPQRKMCASDRFRHKRDISKLGKALVIERAAHGTINGVQSSTGPFLGKTLVGNRNWHLEVSTHCWMRHDQVNGDFMGNLPPHPRGKFEKCPLSDVVQVVLDNILRFLCEMLGNSMFPHGMLAQIKKTQLVEHLA